MRLLSARGLVLALAVAAAGCGDTPVEDCGPGTGVECQSTDEIVAGVNLTRLFAVPTFAELDSARTLWQVPGRQVASRETVERGGRESVTVLFGSDGAPLGAIRQPPRAAGDERVRPLLVVLGDGPDVLVDVALRDLPLRDALRDEFVYLFVAARGGAIRFGSRSFEAVATSDDLYDLGAAADVLSLLDYARQRSAEFGVAADRIGISGHGRGGTVGLLAAAQTNLDDYLITRAAPSSFLLQSVQDATSLYLRGQPFDAFPGLPDVLRETAGRLRDGTTTQEAARLYLIARSPALFTVATQTTRPLAPLVVAHGGLDIVVPEEHGRALDVLIRASGDGVYLSRPDATHETILQDPQVVSTSDAFLCDTLLAGQSICPR